MSWIAAILLAVLCFGAIVVTFRLPRKAWAVLLAALSLGLAGYATQASPGLPGAPGKGRIPEQQEGWGIVETRYELIGPNDRSKNKLVVTADALVRQGQYANAAALLQGVVRENPNDGDAWLALANALTFHADGTLTPATLYAYRRASQAAPESAGPAFFVGVGLIGQGRLVEAHQMWAERLSTMPENAPGRDQLAARLGELEELMRRIAARAAENPQ